MGANRLWRFVLIALMPAALTAMILGAVLAGARGDRCGSSQRASTSPQAQAMPRAGADTAQEMAAPARSAQVGAAQTGSLAYPQLTSWYDGRTARGWHMQLAEGRCSFGTSDKVSCTYVTPKRLSLVVPEQPSAALDGALLHLAGLLASAPSDLQVDIIQYRRLGEVPPPRVLPPSEVVELMLCAKLSEPSAYQACVDTLTPALESPTHKPAHFWQVTLAPTLEDTQSPSLANILHTLQPRAGAALVILGDWSEEETLRAVQGLNAQVHLTVVSQGVEAKAQPSRVCGSTPAAGAKPAASLVLSTPASLALLPIEGADAATLQASVWRRFEPRPLASQCSTNKQGRSRFSKRTWYKSYLGLLFGWYGIGLMLLLAMLGGSSAYRCRKQARDAQRS
jgi:hypothetical protein